MVLRALSQTIQGRFTSKLQCFVYLHSNQQLTDIFMNKFPLKSHQWGTVTPFKVFDNDQQDDSLEASYLQLLQNSLQSVLDTLEEDRRQYELRFSIKFQNLEEKLQEKEQIIQELLAANEYLKLEKGQLKVSLQQMVRYAKSYELKHQLLNNKINHLTQQLSEKEAVIRYLEAKTHPNTNPNNTAKHIQPPSLSFQQIQEDNSFKSLIHLPCPVPKNMNDIKFEDFKVTIRKDKQDVTGKEVGKARRNRTQSNQNENGQNMSWRGSGSKLGELVSARAWGKKDDKSLLKKYPSNCDYSFWKYSNKQQPLRNHRSSGMFASTCFLQCRLQNASFSRDNVRPN